MKSTAFAFVVPFLALGATALPQSTDSGLTGQVPRPPCLCACIQTYGNCAICTPSGDAAITACYEATCGGPPTGSNPYAGVYYSTICSDGGYQDFTTTPPHFVTIPPTDCSH